jgi:hypothetical protein
MGRDRCSFDIDMDGMVRFMHVVSVYGGENESMINT